MGKKRRERLLLLQSRVAQLQIKLNEARSLMSPDFTSLAEGMRRGVLALSLNDQITSMLDEIEANMDEVKSEDELTKTMTRLVKGIREEMRETMPKLEEFIAKLKDDSKGQ